MQWGWTQGMVTEIMGVSHDIIHQWEAGLRTPSGIMLARLCILYRVRVQDLCEIPDEAAKEFPTTKRPKIHRNEVLEILKNALESE